MIGHDVEVMDAWARIYERDCPLVVEDRDPPLGADKVAELLADAPFSVRVDGKVETIARQLGQFPDALVADIEALAVRFAVLTGNNAVRVRVEGITTNACKKVHADYTDLRLITTYAGPGTDYVPHGDPGCCLERMPAGATGLFKGKLFSRLVGEDGHAPCLHRSPPIEGSKEARLVLVIDTPFRDATSSLLSGQNTARR